MRPTSRVLLVDDKEAVRESLQLSLEGFGCVFGEAGTGAAALNLLQDWQFDVTFLEVDLPDMKGMEFLRQARGRSLAVGEVIVVTALLDPKAEAEAKGLGAFRYLEKPLEYEQIRSIFGEATSTAAAAVTPIVVRPDESQIEIAPLPARHRRVLVLDDHADWILQIRDSLENDFEVVLTTDEDDACRRSNQERFDIVVIERKLARGISGFDVLSLMRMARVDLRAIILSDFSDFKPLLDLSSAIGYVSKKDLETLAQTINLFLDHPIERKKVFLSYAKVDRDRVLPIYEALMTRGYLPWMDVKSITPGKKWEPEILAAIDASNFFVYCLSNVSAIKEGMIVKELKRALDKQAGLRDPSRFIITARLDEVPVDPPLDPFQWVDLFPRQGMLHLLAALSALDTPQKPSTAHAPTIQVRRPVSSTSFFDEPIADLIARGESADLEFKSTLRWDLRSQKANKDLESVVVKTVSSFLNAYDGGILLIGVADNGAAVGLEHDYRTLKSKSRDGFQLHAHQLLLEAYGNDVAPLVRFRFDVFDGKDICRIKALPAHKAIYVGGRLYIRTGNATHELSAQEAVEYTRERWK